MIDDDCRELIHADIDGELPEQRRAELSRYLLADPQARAYAQDMQRVCQALDAMPQAAPPQGLREAIMRRIAIPGRESAAAARRAYAIPAGPWRYAAVFAGGLLASALAFQLAGPPGAGIATSDLVGTMTGHGPGRTAGPTDSIRLEFAQLRGQVNLYDAGSMVILEFDFAAQQPTEVVAVYDGGQARFSRAAGATAEGPRRYALELPRSRDTPGAVTLQFFVAGNLLHEARLATAVGN